MFERFFRLQSHGATLRGEVIGGVTTFVTMAYIIVVNPAILSAIGIPVGPSTVATILVAAIGTMLMGLYANRPIAVAPYMGENAFVAFSLAAMGIAVTWQQALGAVFLSGLAFLIITLVGIRGWLANSISPSMKHSFAVGIGLFLAFIGLNLCGLVVPGQGVPVKIGNLRETSVILAILGFLLMMILIQRRVPGAILIGMVATGLAGCVLGLGSWPKGVAALPFAGEYSLSGLAFQMDLAGVLKASFLPVLLTLFLMSFLDTLGTLVAVGSAANLLDEKGNFPQIERPMTVDAVSCVAAGLLGTTTSGAYIESATGIREGARTGLASVVTAALFLVALFFIPLFAPLQELKFAYGPALIAVGVLMLSSFRKIDFEDLTELVPAFATIAMMVFTYNIGNGLTAGLVLYPVMKLAAGRGRELSGGAIVLAVICLAYYVFGLPH